VIVVDASAAVDYLLATGAFEQIAACIAAPPRVFTRRIS
jgi:hypothetical protein